jgi:triosephosphate isomerase
MARGIVAANWKMHGSRQFLQGYVRSLETAPKALCERLILFPPVGYLLELSERLDAAGLGQAVEVGAQNLHTEPAGAFTGEMSAEMLVDLGASWVLAGHSERRQLAGETDEQVGRKVAAALRAGLKPMVCVGETEAQRNDGLAGEVVGRQLDAVLAHCSVEELATGAVAYEPVWAIGTGRTATPELAQEMHGLIRQSLASRSQTVAAGVPLLYGGSVKAGNAAELFGQPDIDGGLVGGASLEAAEFLSIAGCLPEVTADEQ